MNQILENIMTRRSIRAFTDQEIKKEDLDLILKAGLYAPSGKNKQSWQFTVLRKKENIQTIAKVIQSALNRPESYQMYDPNAIILVSNEKDNVNGLADSACALQNMFLMAHSIGIGSCWINQLRGICDEEQVRKVLDIYKIPQNHVVWGIAALGYAKTPTKEGVRNTDIIQYAD